MKFARGNDDSAHTLLNECLPQCFGLAYRIISILGTNGDDSFPRHTEQFKYSNPVLIPGTTWPKPFIFKASKQIGFSVSVDYNLSDKSFPEKLRRFYQAWIVFYSGVEYHDDVGSSGLFIKYQELANGG